MKIAVTLNAHGNTELVLDTILSIKKHVTEDILVIVDGAKWESWGKITELPVHKICGFYHNYPKSPYRNITFGLMNTAKLFPDADWYCYTEYDTLFAADSFKEDLELGKNENVWLIGNDLRFGNMHFPLIERMLRTSFKNSRYLLGCCLFYNSEFIRLLENMNFFERFLWLTNDFSHGFFPGYEEQGGYDLVEHLYPTLADHFGGKVKGMAYWEDNVWHGNQRYAMRWKPELKPEEMSLSSGAAIFHPIKTLDHPIRVAQRTIRND